ncbi:hypothetical protein [Pseudomonas huanghezhanensis]|uniref:hypothetical protein n=1 Tax=Pseudomonas huanghezhanensis TaxID=3002903 RepID=UPI0022862195|nr:hypothetical protein [Pseudomonas sp. BSw22131]
MKKLAEDAGFELSAARERLEWFAALARAIARDVEHCEGRDVQLLAQLAKHLGDTGVASADAAIDQFEQIAHASSEAAL